MHTSLRRICTTAVRHVVHPHHFPNPVLPKVAQPPVVPHGTAAVLPPSQAASVPQPAAPQAVAPVPRTWAVRLGDAVRHMRQLYYGSADQLELYRRMPAEEFQALRTHSVPLAPEEAAQLGGGSGWKRGLVWSKMGLISGGNEAAFDASQETFLYRFLVHCEQGAKSGYASVIPELLTPWTSWTTSRHVVNEYAALKNLADLNEGLPIVTARIPRYLAYRGNKCDKEFVVRGGTEITWRQLHRSELEPFAFPGPGQGTLGIDGLPLENRILYVPALGRCIPDGRYVPPHEWPRFPPPRHVNSWHVKPAHPLPW